MDTPQQKIVLVVRKSRLEDLVARFNTLEQARFYVEHLGADFGDYELEHRVYQAAIIEVEATLSRFGRVHRLDRGFLPSFLFPPGCLVVVLGQDGLVANTLKYLDGQAVVGVNPDPARWDGALLPFRVRDLSKLIPDALAGRRPTRSVTMACARLNDGQELYAVNDLFIGPRTHVSARYVIRSGDAEEVHSSSGVIVSTGLGSTGWFKSLMTGALGIAGDAAGSELAALRDRGFAWDADYLMFTVREPFPSKTTHASVVFGRVSSEAPLRIVSQMPDYGVIFSDGIERDFLEFNAGMEASIAPGRRRGHVIA